MKTYYDVLVYGRKNSIVLSIKGKLLYEMQMIAETKSEAKDMAWEYIKDTAEHGWLKRSDFTIDAFRNGEEVTYRV